MIAAWPGRQSAGVARFCFALSCSASITRRISSKLRPALIGYTRISLTFLSGPITNTLRTVMLSAAVRAAAAPPAAAGSMW
jgi:hypothetical protein